MAEKRRKEDCQNLTCFALFGVVLLACGVLLLVFQRDDACPCNSEHCCERNDTCPDNTPCLCASADAESTNNTCLATEIKYEDYTNVACVMIALGATLIFIFAIVPAGLEVYSVFQSSESIWMVPINLCDAIVGAVKRMVSKPYAESDSMQAKHPLIPHRY